MNRSETKFDGPATREKKKKKNEQKWPDILRFGHVIYTVVHSREGNRQTHKPNEGGGRARTHLVRNAENSVLTAV